MNETRRAACGSSPRPPKNSSAVHASDSNSSSTWYDVPALIAMRDTELVEKQEEKEKEEKKEEEKTIATESNAAEATKSTMGIFREEREREGERPRDKRSVHPCPGQDEVLYQNNVEAALNSLSKVCAEPLRADLETDLPNGTPSPGDKEEDEAEGSTRRRHSSSVELAATSTVKIGRDGMPTISFSFLRTEEKPCEVVAIKKEETGAEEEKADREEKKKKKRKKEEEEEDGGRRGKENVEEVPLDRLYDFPKRKVVVEEEESSDQIIQSDLYDVPNFENSPTCDGSHAEESAGDREIVATDRDEFASVPGEESPEHVRSLSRGAAERHLKRHKRRLGKAWGRMRSWLKEEKTKIGDVVARHARMQAVGALRPESLDGGGSASHDFTTEDRGLSSVSEEGNASDEDGVVSRIESAPRSPDSIVVIVDDDHDDDDDDDNDDDDDDDDDDEETRERLPPRANDERTNESTAPVSLDRDKLRFDGENEENSRSSRTGAADARDPVGRGGLIGRRMLGSIRGLMASTHLLQALHEIEEGGQGGFEDVRRYVKQGGDFCKELAAILHERAELEASYAKGLGKLSGKLAKACSKDQGTNSAGGVNEAWRSVGEEMEAAAEAHRVWGIALGEQLAKPLRVGVAEAQGRSRKVIENSVDKAAKSLQEWRGIAAKSKKQSFACARENERLQDIARLQSLSQSQQNNNNNNNNNNKSNHHHHHHHHHHMTEKEANKLETRRRKAEDSSRRADTEFYTVSVRAERARLEYESTVRKGAKQMELLEEERLSALKDLANVYLAHLQALAPRLQQSADRLSSPVRNCSVSRDVEILSNLIRRMDGNDAANTEQLLPDFYAEHVTLAMNRERRKQALVRVLHLIRQDLERERRGREGLETLHRAFVATPAFAADESTQNVTDKLLHMRSMLTYLEAARFKVGGTLAEVEGGKRGKHPLAEHILVSRDKQGLQQSVLKVPPWAKNESFQLQEEQDDLEVRLTKSQVSDSRDWADRTAGDGNSENPPDEEDFSDFDEFSSQSEDNNNQEIDTADVASKGEGGMERCRAMYQYSANLNDELSLNPGDLITIHEKQADGWWIGECRGRTGIFPATYVQVIH